ncbi:ribosomal biogenesis factor isoform X2 [Latimeria chalumnae]|uniref:ribosomal biogenesis factor isoform X2 n=1 Tax=Latimeria chalumnae TaxID=7897 RepID=UPI0006D8EE29|nr:PREDICTED: uncharacterized protein C8orf59 homolog [Latimeria chalumnae]|eukprot:XP_014352715.1 PREDICTED: uncharacterized protein C8orf59 homolog [Latimeria chalumnae]
MAKNKSRGQKQKNVFQVANNKPTKAKNKAQPVTTNLKKINVKNSDKTTTVNKVFTELQREVKSLSKGTVVEPEKLQQVSRLTSSEQPNVDATTHLLSQL